MEVNNIIKEEFQNFLKEGYVMEHENLRFRQQITTSGFYNFKSFSNDHDVDISESDIIINWRIGFWLSDTGVDSFLVKADSVEGTYKVMLFDKQTDEVVQEIDKNIADDDWKFQIYEATLRLKDALKIETLDFDFQTKICTVTFFDSDKEDVNQV